MAAVRSGAAAILADGRTRDGVVRYLAAAADRPAGELAGLPDSEIAGLLPQKPCLVRRCSGGKARDEGR